MSRRAIFVVAAIFLSGISLGLLLSQIVVSPKSTKRVAEITPEATSTGVVAGSEREKATVKRVIDGDTIELTDGRKVRYIGIDTPETVDPRKPVQCFGKEAADKNKALAQDKSIEMETDISQSDRYGRLLRYIYVKTDDQKWIMVNEALVAEGFALSSTFPPDVKYQDLFQLAQDQARAAGKGLWGGCNVLATPAATTSSDTAEASPVGSGQVVESSPNSNSCQIKGNISSGGKIYHLPGCGSYDKTVIDETAGERWFCTEEEAINAGWRKAKNC
ncbi:hypothetical protein A2699_00255 [Candidatus Gottesmanbacteria bacterium RIFCSPHIGHO2_01_FULL_43_15]|nr:MAG: hypothetical protein A2699_00255 [Candidatus Gottesmanbacteria bacterium RIFCSPHIGHO2_01_FULL_43_15]